MNTIADLTRQFTAAADALDAADDAPDHTYEALVVARDAILEAMVARPSSTFGELAAKAGVLARLIEVDPELDDAGERLARSIAEDVSAMGAVRPEVAEIDADLARFDAECAAGEDEDETAEVDRVYLGHLARLGELAPFTLAEAAVAARWLAREQREMGAEFCALRPANGALAAVLGTVAGGW